MITQKLNKLEKMCKGSLLYSWSHGLSKCNENPSFAYIALNNICNYRCKMCGYKSMMREEKGFMNFKIFKKIKNSVKSKIQ